MSLSVFIVRLRWDAKNSKGFQSREFVAQRPKKGVRTGAMDRGGSGGGEGQEPRTATKDRTRSDKTRAQQQTLQGRRRRRLLAMTAADDRGGRAQYTFPHILFG